GPTGARAAESGPAVAAGEAPGLEEAPEGVREASRGSARGRRPEAERQTRLGPRRGRRAVPSRTPPWTESGAPDPWPASDRPPRQVSASRPGAAHAGSAAAR